MEINGCGSNERESSGQDRPVIAQTDDPFKAQKQGFTITMPKFCQSDDVSILFPARLETQSPDSRRATAGKRPIFQAMFTDAVCAVDCVARSAKIPRQETLSSKSAGNRLLHMTHSTAEMLPSHTPSLLTTLQFLSRKVT